MAASFSAHSHIHIFYASSIIHFIGFFILSNNNNAFMILIIWSSGSRIDQFPTKCNKIVGKKKINDFFFRDVFRSATEIRRKRERETSNEHRRKCSNQNESDNSHRFFCISIPICLSCSSKNNTKKAHTMNDRRAATGNSYWRIDFYTFFFHEHNIIITNKYIHKSVHFYSDTMDSYTR